MLLILDHIPKPKNNNNLVTLISYLFLSLSKESTTIHLHRPVDLSIPLLIHPISPVKMKYTVVASLLFSLVAADAITDLIAQIPQCAIACLTTAATSIGCSAMDYSCQCKAMDKMTAAALSCITSSGCTNDEIASMWPQTSLLLFFVSVANL
jgi:hypothetical protein